VKVGVTRACAARYKGAKSPNDEPGDAIGPRRFSAARSAGRQARKSAIVPRDNRRRGNAACGWFCRSSIDRDFRKRAQSDLAVDKLLGEVMQALAATGHAQNTYIVFSSDNGYHMGEHNLRPGKMTAFDMDIRVPLIVTGPAVPLSSSRPTSAPRSRNWPAPPRPAPSMSSHFGGCRNPAAFQVWNMP